MPEYQELFNQITFDQANVKSLVFVTLNDELLADSQVVYASTRQNELAQTGWPEAQKQQFLSQQFQAQHTHYQTHYASGEYLLIQSQQHTIGRVFIQESKQAICLIDIALLPEQQKQGIAGKLLETILEQAQSKQKIITLHVEKHNPAFAWYLRLGFQAVEDRGIYQYMEWHPIAN